MTTLRERLSDLRALPPELVEVEAEAFMEHAGSWPITTTIPLDKLAYVVVALLNEENMGVRRVRVEEAITLRDPIG